MTANRKILPPFQYFCFLFFWSSIRWSAAAEPLPTAVHCGHPRRQLAGGTGRKNVTLTTFETPPSPPAAASPLPRCTADTRSPRRRKTIWRNIVTVVFASSTPLVLCHSYFCEVFLEWINWEREVYMLHILLSLSQILGLDYNGSVINKNSQ